MADNLGIIRWFVDASYAIHNDCKGHTGSMVTKGLEQLQVSQGNNRLMKKVQQRLNWLE